MSSDVFIVASARNRDTAAALRQATELASVEPGRVEDLVFGLAASARGRDAGSITRLAGLSCRSAAVSPSLRALFFAAESILGGDTELSLAAVIERGTTTAVLLASAEMVGRLNLLPRARLAARSLAGAEAAARAAGLTMAEIEICKEAQGSAALHELLDELEARPARWGLLTAGSLGLLLERI